MLQAAGGAAGLLLMAATFDGSATVQAGFDPDPHPHHPLPSPSS